MAAQTVINDLDELKAKVGQHLGTSEWLEVTQDLVDRFAEVTNDHQWIHVDPERAKDTPFGGTIAHGLFTLSIGPGLIYTIYEVNNVAFALNYGYNKVRFPAPMVVGSRVRLHATLTSVEEIPGGAQTVVTQTFEREGSEKPVCVAEGVGRVVFNT
jgi:acyl dehydratase